MNALNNLLRKRFTSRFPEQKAKSGNGNKLEYGFPLQQQQQQRQRAARASSTQGCVLKEPPLHAL
jgi:hypothetical protein